MEKSLDAALQNEIFAMLTQSQIPLSSQITNKIVVINLCFVDNRKTNKDYILFFVIDYLCHRIKISTKKKKTNK